MLSAPLKVDRQEDLLRILRDHNPKIDRLVKDCRKEGVRMLDKTWSKKDEKLKKKRTKVRKVISSFSAEPAYIHLLEYMAKRLKVCKGRFLRFIIAEYAYRFIPAKELDKKPLVRKWYLEVIQKEIWGNRRLKSLYDDVEEEGISVGVKGRSDL